MDLIHLVELLQRRLPPPVEIERHPDGTVFVRRRDDLEIRIRPTEATAWIHEIWWDSQIPRPVIPGADPVVVPLDGLTPDAVVRRLSKGLEKRLRTYRKCVDCGEIFPPERMSGDVCHGCGHRRGYVY